MKYELLIIFLLFFGSNIDVFGQGKFGGGDGAGYGMTEASNITLPAELIHFDASYIEDRDEVQIHWEAVSEVNLDYYTLEKSKDATNWESLGIHYPNASLKYQFLDRQPYDGISYYRLRYKDLDGKIGFSKIATIHIDNNDVEINISPNPSRQFVNISIHTTQKSEFTIRISDTSGKVVWEQRMKEAVMDWNSQIEINEKGIYTVNVITGSGVFSEKVIILD